MVSLVDSAVVLLLHHRELDVDDGLLLGGDVLRHVLLSTPEHVGLESPAQRPRLSTEGEKRDGRKQKKKKRETNMIREKNDNHQR